MFRIICISKRVIKEFINQPKTLIMLVVAPIMSLSIMLNVLNINSKAIKSVKIGYTDQQNESIISAAKTIEQISVVKFENEEDGLKSLASQEIDLMILDGESGNQTINVKSASTNAMYFDAYSDILNALSQKIAALRFMSQSSIDQMSKKGYQFNVENIYKGVEKYSAANSFAPGFTISMIFFFVFFTGSVAFIDERNSGTMSRIMASPLKPYELLMGFLLAFLFLALAQIAVLNILYIYGFKFSHLGSLWAFTAVGILTSVFVLLMAILISIISQNETEANQYIPALILPQMILGGFFNLSALEWLDKLSYYIPLNLSFSCASGIMLRGLSLFDAEVYERLLILSVYIVVLFLINVMSLKTFKPKNRS